VTSLNATGTYSENPSDTSGYNSDPLGVGWIVFDTTGPKTAAGTSRIFVGTETLGAPAIYASVDGGVTWAPVPGQDTKYITHHGVLAPAEKSLYVTYVNRAFGSFADGR
jgi:xyloglucan-specific exo-beta-1,4-glucanase